MNFEVQCHCGCASLTKASFFGDYLEIIDEEVINNCPSDDMTYSYFTNKAGHPYVRTKDLYSTNMIVYNNQDSYSSSFVSYEK